MVRRALAAVATLYMTYLLLLPLLGLYLVRLNLSPSVELALDLLLGQVVLLLLTVLFLPRKRWQAVVGWRSGKVSWRLIFGGVAIYVIGSFVLGLISLVLMDQLGLPSETARQQVLLGVFETTDPLIIWLTPIVLAVIAPLGEELFFRGLVYGLLRPSSRFWATTVSAVAFAVLHQEPAAFVGHLGFGLYLAWLRERSGSVWPSVATHSLANLTLYLLARVAGQIV